MNKEDTVATTISNNIPIASFRVSDLAWTVILILLAVAAPAIFAHTPHNQWITGTIVNALLFIAGWRLGVVNAFAIAAMPSTVALIRGLLPTPMAVMIPYIIMANFLLVIVFMALKKKLFLGIISASLVKFGFLFIAATFLSAHIGLNLIVMFQWPQLATALAGGLVSIPIIKFLKDRA
ncbi:MAG: hypothetical protein U9M90_00165 [Patescibacteria group bacterium]|nr:hypothetical protein [Patescibacteria group bacterium]